MPGQGEGGTTSIKCRWTNGFQRFYDRATDETVHVMAQMWFTEDFLGEGGLELGNTVDRWEVIDVGDATEALRADIATGVWRLALTATSEAQDAGLYWGDQTSICVLNDVSFETKIDVAVLPSVSATAVWGMAGDHNLDKDTVAEHAWFRLDASGTVKVETDDGTTDTDDTATGITAVAGTANIYRIDFSDLSDVKFYIDGARVAGSTTHDLSALTTTTGLMQPYFSVDKAASVSVGTLDIDYCRIWGRRSSTVGNS